MVTPFSRRNSGSFTGKRNSTSGVRMSRPPHRIAPYTSMTDTSK